MRDLTDFTSRLAAAVTGAAHTPLVFLGNFEVERHWADGEHTLPRLTADNSAAVVNHMDEFSLLLARPDDHVVLKTRPDTAFLDYLRALGLGLPRLHVVTGQDPRRSVTEDALADPGMVAELTGLARDGAVLTAHGVSTVEEHLAARCGLPLAAPAASVCKAVNSKVYSRQVATDLGLRQPAGRCATTLAELRDALDWARGLLAEGRRVVIKEAYGVSGKGIVELRGLPRIERLFGITEAKVTITGQDRVAFVVEEWVASQGDLNYQFTVHRDGTMRFDFVKEARTEGGVHKGHRIPARLPAEHVDTITATAAELGKRLAADGYFGVVGVDALVDADGGIYPVIEINARNNMSTYQVRVQERFFTAGQVALARHYPLRLRERLDFGALRSALVDRLIRRPGDTGLLVNNFATVNAGQRPGVFDGRLYGLVFAGDSAELDEIDADVTRRLAALEGVDGGR